MWRKVRPLEIKVRSELQLSKCIIFVLFSMLCCITFVIYEHIPCFRTKLLLPLTSHLVSPAVPLVRFLFSSIRND